MRKCGRFFFIFFAASMLYLGETTMTAAVSFSEMGERSIEQPESIYLSKLPDHFIPFEQFQKEFALGETSTEQFNPITRSLSQVMHQNVSQGMELLLKVDEEVAKGLESFIPFVQKLTHPLAEKIGAGGRVFLVGSGSSGRVAVDIAAKCRSAFPLAGDQIHGVIAGGDSAFVRAKEGFEDSEADGAAALKEYGLGPNDTVILISASGSASFNVGCGHFAANCGSSVLYFYNSEHIPNRTAQLFSRINNPVVPMCIDIGPQAISGSTRLQGATLAEACLGALLSTALYQYNGKEELASGYASELLAKLNEGVALICSKLDIMAKFADIERGIFSDPRSNFRQLRDVSNQGYVTFVSREDCIREILIDSTETSPTFSTNPICRKSEVDKKRAEFCAFLVGQEDNPRAWKALLGRDIHPSEAADTEAFLLACEEAGVNSFQMRPHGKGNLVMGVAKVDALHPISEQLIDVLDAVKLEGGCTGLILICNGKIPEELESKLREGHDLLLVMEETPHDPVGFSETIVLKQVLNLISNASMVLMNKVHGNQMIDVRASNNKLIDRCSRLIKGIWSEYHSDFPLSDRDLYHYVAHVSAMKKSYSEKGIYTPSVVKIVLAMLALRKTPDHFQEIVDILREKEERIDWIGE